MVRLREHVNRLGGGHFVASGGDLFAVAGEVGGVAADVDNAVGLELEHGVERFGVHSGARGVGDDNTRFGVRGERLLHGVEVLEVGLEKDRVLEAVQFGVHRGIADGAFDHLDADRLLAVAGEVERDGAGAAVEVVDRVLRRDAADGDDLVVERFGLAGVGLEKGVGGNAEIEVAEPLGDVSFTADDVLLLARGHRVPAGGDVVDDGHLLLRHGRFEPLLQRLHDGLFVPRGDDVHHELVMALAVAEHHVTQKSLVRLGGVGREAAFEGEVAHDVQHRVHALLGEVAGVEVEHLLEVARRVEAEGKAFRLCQLLLRHLGGQEVTHIRAGELHLVAVVERLRRGQHRQDVGVLEAAEVRERVHHLFVLEAELRLVADVHPLASAADAEDRADRLDAIRRRREHFDGASFEVARLYLVNLRRNAVAGREHASHHDGHSLGGFAEALLFLGMVDDGEFDDIAFSVADFLLFQWSVR